MAAITENALFVKQQKRLSEQLNIWLSLKYHLSLLKPDYTEYL